MKTKLRIEIESSFENTAFAGAAVEGAAREAGLDKSGAADVRLCTEEACNNCIEHAYKSEDNKTVEIEFGIDDDSIIVSIADIGITISNMTIQRPDPEPDNLESLPERGMGLFIIDSLSDSMKYYTKKEKNVLEFTKIITNNSI